MTTFLSTNNNALFAGTINISGLNAAGVDIPPINTKSKALCENLYCARAITCDYISSNVHGNSDLHGYLNVQANVNVGTDFIVKGNAYINGKVNVNNNIKCNDVFCSNIFLEEVRSQSLYSDAVSTNSIICNGPFSIKSNTKVNNLYADRSEIANNAIAVGGVNIYGTPKAGQIIIANDQYNAFWVDQPPKENTTPIIPDNIICESINTAFIDSEAINCNNALIRGQIKMNSAYIKHEIHCDDLIKSKSIECNFINAKKINCESININRVDFSGQSDNAIKWNNVTMEKAPVRSGQFLVSTNESAVEWQDLDDTVPPGCLRANSFSGGLVIDKEKSKSTRLSLSSPFSVFLHGFGTHTIFLPEVRRGDVGTMFWITAQQGDQGVIDIKYHNGNKFYSICGSSMPSYCMLVCNNKLDWKFISVT